MKSDTGTIVAIVAALLLFTGFAVKTKLLTPVRGRVSSRYGKRGNEFHNGVDIAIPTGTEVKTPLEGTVRSIFTTTRGGKQMVVDHPGGYTSGYAHLSKFYFGSGAKVKKGKRIALSGNTGESTGAHLHFSWRKNGDYKNPERYFSF